MSDDQPTPAAPTVSYDVAIFLKDLVSQQKLNAGAPDLVPVAHLCAAAQDQLQAIIDAGEAK